MLGFILAYPIFAVGYLYRVRNKIDENVESKEILINIPCREIWIIFRTCVYRSWIASTPHYLCFHS